MTCTSRAGDNEENIIKKENAAFVQHYKIWMGQNISRRTKLRIFKELRISTMNVKHSFNQPFFLQNTF